MMKKYFILLIIPVLIQGIFIAVKIPEVHSQGGGLTYGRPVIDLINNSKVIASSAPGFTNSAKIFRSNSKAYSLKISTLPFEVNTYKPWIEGKINIFRYSDNTTDNISLFPRQNFTENKVYERVIPIDSCSAGNGMYKYRVTYYSNTYPTGYHTAELPIEFVNPSNNTDPCSGTTPGQTPPIIGGTNTGGVNAPVNGNIPNTNVGVNFNVNLDQELGSFFNPLQKGTVPEIITALIRILFALIGILAVIIIIVSGFRMVTASGNEEQLTKAKKAITWAIIGLIVSLLAFSIVAIVQRLIQVGAN